MDQFDHCFICGKPAKIESSGPPTFNFKVKCERCHNYEITRTLAAATGDWDRIVPEEKRYILSGILRERKNSEKPILLFSSTSNIDKLIQNADVPTDPIESIERLLLYIYDNTKSADQEVTIIPDNDYPIIFAKNAVEFSFLREKAKLIGWIEQVGTYNGVRLKIPDGWKKVAELKSRNKNVGHFAFMAMEYNNQEQDEIFKDYLLPAVAQTGFELKLLKNLLGAGLIDNQLRVQIRRAKFLLADLTNKNLGAYWEAGYAEGLGKQVIYLCKESEFKEMKTHFDTNHHTTIRWDKENMSQAVEELKATIRATFPAEAKMNDK